MEQDLMSSARISASLVLPKFVRSPHSTATSARVEISANISRKGASSSSRTWRSPIAATRNFWSSAILLFEIADRFGNSPFLDIPHIIALTANAAAAHLLSRPLDPGLAAKPLEQFVNH